jgi:hypothetical protein
LNVVFPPQVDNKGNIKEGSLWINPKASTTQINELRFSVPNIETVWNDYKSKHATESWGTGWGSGTHTLKMNAVGDQSTFSVIVCVDNVIPIWALVSSSTSSGSLEASKKAMFRSKPVAGCSPNMILVLNYPADMPVAKPKQVVKPTKPALKPRPVPKISMSIDWSNVIDLKSRTVHGVPLDLGIAGSIKGGWNASDLASVKKLDTFLKGIDTGDDLYLARWAVNTINLSNTGFQGCPGQANTGMGGNFPPEFNAPNFQCYARGWMGGTGKSNDVLPIANINIANGKLSNISIKTPGMVWPMGNVNKTTTLSGIESYPSRSTNPKGTNSLEVSVPSNPSDVPKGLFIALLKKKPALQNAPQMLNTMFGPYYVGGNGGGIVNAPSLPVEGVDYVLLPLPTPGARTSGEAGQWIQSGGDSMQPCIDAGKLPSKTNVTVNPKTGALSGCWVYPATKNPPTRANWGSGKTWFGLMGKTPRDNITNDPSVTKYADIGPGVPLWTKEGGLPLSQPVGFISPTLAESMRLQGKQVAGTGASVVIGPPQKDDPNFPSYVKINGGGSGFCVSKGFSTVHISGVLGDAGNNPFGAVYLSIPQTSDNQDYCNGLMGGATKQSATAQPYMKNCVPMGKALQNASQAVYRYSNDSTHYCPASSQCGSFTESPAASMYWYPYNEYATDNVTLDEYKTWYDGGWPEKCAKMSETIPIAKQAFDWQVNVPKDIPEPVRENVPCLGVGIPADTMDQKTGLYENTPCLVTEDDITVSNEGKWSWSREMDGGKMCVQDSPYDGAMYKWNLSGCDCKCDDPTEIPFCGSVINANDVWQNRALSFYSGNASSGTANAITGWLNGLDGSPAQGYESEIPNWRLARCYCGKPSSSSSCVSHDSMIDSSIVSWLGEENIKPKSKVYMEALFNRAYPPNSCEGAKLRAFFNYRNVLKNFIKDVSSANKTSATAYIKSNLTPQLLIDEWQWWFLLGGFLGTRGIQLPGKGAGTQTQSWKYMTGFLNKYKPAKGTVSESYLPKSYADVTVNTEFIWQSGGLTWQEQSINGFFEPNWRDNVKINPSYQSCN